jgi:hypothetical protein
MDEVRTPRLTQASRSRRDRRRELALAAQYVHDLSERHARDRRVRRPAARPGRIAPGASTP